VSGPERVLVTNLPQRHRDDKGDLGFIDRHDLDFRRGLGVSVVSIRAKQTQSPGTDSNRCRVGLAPPRLVAEEESVGQAPPYHSPEGGTSNGADAREPACETNPICSGARGGQVPCGTKVGNDPAQGESGETNPICRGVSSAQSPAANPPGLPTSNFRLSTRETKPIPLERSGRASTLWEKSYDELDTQKTSAKQSQLPHRQQWAGAAEAGQTQSRSDRGWHRQGPWP
jgi:hypothetical protein